MSHKNQTAMKTAFELLLLISLVSLVGLSFYNGYKNATDREYNDSKCGNAFTKFVYGFFEGLSLYFIGIVFLFVVVVLCGTWLYAIGQAIYQLFIIIIN